MSFLGVSKMGSFTMDTRLSITELIAHTLRYKSVGWYITGCVALNSCNLKNKMMHHLYSVLFTD